MTSFFQVAARRRRAGQRLHGLSQDLSVVGGDEPGAAEQACDRMPMWPA